tara:strand:- start:338 stop:2572 length:2235 start_codon:yes stop_codon:yes gene_type:complete
MAENFEQSKNNAKELKNSLADVEKNIKKINDLGTESSAVFGSIGTALKGLARDSKDFSSQISDAAKTQKALASNAQALAALEKDNLKDRTKAASFAKIASKVAQGRVKIESQIRVLTAKRVNATKAEKAILDKTIENLQNGEFYTSGIAKGFDEISDVNKELNSNTKFFNNMEEILGSIPGLGPAIAKPFTTASKAVRNARVDGEGLGKSLAKGANEIAKSFGPGLFVASIFNANKNSAEFAKNLGISVQEASDIRQDFTLIALNSGKAYLNAEKLMHAQMELGEVLGAQVGFTDKQLKSQVALTKKLGLSSEEAAELNRQSILTGKSTDEITTGVLDTVVALEKETGIRLNGKKVLAEVAKATGQLGAQYSYNTKALAEAVVQSQKLGLSLKESAQIASQLLNFESSIEAELEAELLTGKSLNLERARALALQGKSAEAVTEIAKQVGTSAEFAEMNVIQQESLAKAAGMSADQLADSLRTQETLQALGVSSIEQLAEQGKLEELKNTKNGEALYKQYQQQAAADKFADTIIKIQSAIGSVGEQLTPVLNIMGKLAESTYAVYTTLGLIGAVTLVNVAKSIAGLTTQIALSKILSKQKDKEAKKDIIGSGSRIAGAFATNPITAVLGIALAGAFIGAALSNLAKADDLLSPGKNSSGYGSRTLLGPEGAIALNNKDTVIAGTDLFRGNDVVSSPAGAVQMPDNSEAKRTNALLEALINKPAPKVQMDSIEVGTVAGISAFSIQ